MRISSRRHSHAFLTDILQAKATAIREDLSYTHEFKDECTSLVGAGMGSNPIRSHFC